MVVQRTEHRLAGCCCCLAAAALAICFVGQIQAAAQATRTPNLVATCAPCHGFEGIGKDVEIPNLAGQHDLYLSYRLRAFRSGRRKHTDLTSSPP
jgi:cytochrome c553